MKARQIAIAIRSVYALDEQDRVRFIERDSDGLWRAWQDAGAEARQIVHEGDVVARVGLDRRVSVLQRSPRLPWQDLDLEADGLAVTRMHDGAPALFASDGDSLVWHTRKPTPSSPWTAWQSLAGCAGDLKAVQIPGGGLALFGIQDGAIHHRWQDRPLGDWKDWTAIDGLQGAVSAIEVGTITGGGLVLFAVGADGGLYHRWQDKPFGRWHPWEPLGTNVQHCSVTKPSNGGLAVFVVGRDGGLRHRRQGKPFGSWSAWTDLDRAVLGVAAQPSYMDGLEVFRIGLDHEVSHRWCDTMDGPWTTWMRLDREEAPFRLSTS